MSYSYVYCCTVLVLLIVFVNVSIAIDSTNGLTKWCTKQCSMVNIVQQEINYYDFRFGLVLKDKQQTLWNTITAQTKTELTGENDLLFPEQFVRWAKDRYYSLLHCDRECWHCANQTNWADVCQYLSEVIRRFDTSPSFSSSSLAWTDLGSKIKELDHKWNRLSIVYNGSLYTGVDSVNSLLETVVDEHHLQTIWKQWTVQLAHITPSFEQIRSQIRAKNSFSELWRRWNQDLGIEPVEQVLPQAYTLWSQVEQFHSLLMHYVRVQLSGHYVHYRVWDQTPAHLLRSLSGPQMNSIFELVKPYAEPIYDKRQIKTVTEFVTMGEKIYQKFTFEPLSNMFWRQSQITNTNNCQPLTLDFFVDSPRVRMCEKDLSSEGSFRKFLHELGHVHYFRSYSKMIPNLYKLNVNSAIHESVGEVVTLLFNGCRHSPNYWTKEMLVNRLLHEALTSLVRIPYALTLEQWRWDIFTNDKLLVSTSTTKLNQHYWNLRKKIEKISSPFHFTNQFSDNLDPLSKYHVVNFVPYIRYLFATFLTHQFHEKICNQENITLAQCCPTNGEELIKFRTFLKYGASMKTENFAKSLRQFLSVDSITYKADSLLRYYQPLINWLIKWKHNNLAKNPNNIFNN